METPKTPTEIKQLNIEYVLKKYLNGQEIWKVIYSQLSDEKLNRLIRDIREG